MAPGRCHGVLGHGPSGGGPTGGQGERGLLVQSGLRHSSLPTEQGVSSLHTEAWAQEWLSGCGLFQGTQSQGRDSGLEKGME